MKAYKQINKKNDDIPDGCVVGVVYSNLKKLKLARQSLNEQRQNLDSDSKHGKRNNKQSKNFE